MNDVTVRVINTTSKNIVDEILSDKIFWVLWNKPYDFKDITNALIVENQCMFFIICY